MKIQRIDPLNRPAIKDDHATLSNEAFYLIAIALLLKKESGTSSLLHYLLPGEKSGRSKKIKA